MKLLTFLVGLVTFVGGQAGVLGALPHAVQMAVQAIAGVLTIIGIRGAPSDPTQAFTQWLDHLGSGWKTATGAVIWLLGTLASPDVLAKLPGGVAHVVAALGAALAALGLYHAQAKTG
jgi:hypothetical protein